MATQHERRRYAAVKAARGPAEHHPVAGMQVVYRHPAGPVQCTLATVAAKYVTVSVQRHGGLPDLTLKFTLRPDGEYRLVGTGNSARPALVFPEEK